MSSQVTADESPKSLSRRIGLLGLVLFGPWAFCLLSAFFPSEAARGLIFSAPPIGFVLFAAGNVAALILALVYVVKGPQRLAIFLASIALAGAAAMLANILAATLAVALSPIYSAPVIHWFIVFPFGPPSGPAPF